MPAKNLLVISTYPPSGMLHGNKFSAVASYAKNTLDNIPGKINIKILADILDKETSYSEDGKKVIRCWKRNSKNIYIDLIKQVFKNLKYGKVLFEFEFGMFGGNKILIGLMPFFLLLLRILGKEVITVSHGVILNADEVSGQLGLIKGSFRTRTLNFILKSIYFLMCLFSTKVIVFEGYLRDKLIEAVGFEHKIFWIPHGVEVTKKIPSKEECRRILNISNDKFIILNFGFVIWYKGSDWLIEKFAELIKQNILDKNKFELIVAGGFSNVHTSDPTYNKYMKDVCEIVDNNSDHIRMTGFLKQEEIDLYFGAADLVVLPYRTLISASGPFSFILTNQSPFILSENLAGYIKSPDFANAMELSKLNKNDLFFNLEDNSIANLILKYSNSNTEIESNKMLSSHLYNSRIWPSIGKMYSDVIFR